MYWGQLYPNKTSHIPAEFIQCAILFNLHFFFSPFFPFLPQGPSTKEEAGSVRSQHWSHRHT